MKRLLAIGLIPLVLGIAGSFLRARELAFAFDPATGLPKQTLTGTTVLIIVGVLILIAGLIIGLKANTKPNPAEKSPGYTAAALVTFAVLLGLACYQFYQNIYTKQVIMLIMAALTLLCAMAIAIIGMRQMRTNDNSVYSFFAIIPVFWACFSLILIFRDRIADPIIADYIFLLFGFICILLFLYTQSGYVYKKNRFCVAIVTAMLGTYFGAIEVLSPVLASKMSAEYVLALNLGEIIPLAIFAIYMPIAAVQMLKNENRI